MKILGENGIGKFLKVFLQICFWGGILLLIALPIVSQIAGINSFNIVLITSPI